MRQLWASEDEYLTLDDIIEDVQDAHDREDITLEEIDAYIECHGLKPAVCNLCDKALPEDAELPLCERCESTAKAHARLERHQREWEEDGCPD